MSQPDVEKYVELYCSILENKTDEWQAIYYELLNEVTKDRALFATPYEQLKEYGQMRDIAETAPDGHTKKCFITALFDALMVEKIKTYSLCYVAPAILSDELQEEYLKQNVYDDEFDY